MQPHDAACPGDVGLEGLLCRRDATSDMGLVLSLLQPPFNSNASDEFSQLNINQQTFRTQILSISITPRDSAAL